MKEEWKGERRSDEQMQKGQYVTPFDSAWPSGLNLLTRS